ncbi:MAG: hypothetical protein QOG62_1301 [Thermoleophilaceae bacterium]|nr:hypothetical protein [Thermoleophilaceae bacterium]
MVVVDDDPIVRGIVVGLLGGTKFEVVGQAEDGVEAVELCDALKPGLVVVDLVMPRLDGIGAIRSILRVSPATRIVALTGAEEDDLCLAAIESGASAVMKKADGLTRLPHLLRQAEDGGVAIFGSLLPSLVDRLGHNEADRLGHDEAEQ